MMMHFQFSHHCYEDRNGRVMFIMERVGFGTIQRYFVGQTHLYALTDTGVVFVMDKEQDFVITIHLADEKMLGWMFNGPIPVRYMKIVRNFKKKNFYKIQKNY